MFKGNTFFGELGGRSHFVMFQNRLYQIDNSPSETDFINIGNQKYGLIPSSDINELETLSKEINDTRIYEYKKNFIESELRQELKNNFRNQINNIEILKFIMYDVFSEIKSEEEDMDALLDGEEDIEKDMKKSIDQLIEEKVGKVEEKEEEDNFDIFKKELIEKYRKEKEKTYLSITEDDLIDQQEQVVIGKKSHTYEGVGKVLNGKPIFVFNDQVYVLEEIKEIKDKTEYIVLSGKSYSLTKSSSIGIIEHKFNRYYASQFKIEAIEEFSEQVEELRKSLGKNKLLEKFVETKTFELGDYGFLTDGNQYAVYLKIPKFAMKHPKEEEYYAFEGCKIGIGLRYNNEIEISQEMSTLEGYNHPFVSGSSLCVGKNEIKTPRTGEDIIRNLGIAKNIIMNGYITGANPHTDLSNFGSQKISKKDAIKRGYAITNVHNKKVKEEEEEDNDSPF